MTHTPAVPGRPFGRAARICLFLICVSMLARSIAWMGLVPAWQTPDEPAHYAYVERLAAGGFPPLERRGGASQALAASLEADAFAAFRSRLSDRPFSPLLRSRLPREAVNLPRSASGALSATNYPPAYYALVLPLASLPWLGTATERLYAVRFGSAIIGVAAVILTFLLLRDAVEDDRLALLGTLLFSLPPMLTQASISCNPDILLVAGCTGLAWTLVRAHRRRPTGTRTLLQVAGWAALVSLTKPIGAAAAFSLTAPFLTVWAYARWGPRALPAIGATVAAAAVGMAAIASTGIDVGKANGHPVLATARAGLSYLWQFYLPRLQGMQDAFAGQPLSQPLPVWGTWVESGVGDFGWLMAGLALWVYQLAAVSAILAIGIAAIALWRTRTSARFDLVALLLAGVLLYVLALHASDFASMSAGDGRLLQGRYLLPMAGVATAALLVALERARPLWRLGTPIALCIVWLVVSYEGTRTVAFYFSS